MSRKKELLKNMGLFAIGSFSTKLLQFLLIPLYTRVLTDYQYGVIDMLQSVATLLIPLISLTIYESVFRYAMEKEKNPKAVLSVGLLISLVNTVVFSILAVIAYKITKYEYIYITVLYIVTHILRSVIAQFTRAIEKLKTYTVDNILNVLITILVNILLIVKFDMGIAGYLIGYIVANVFSVIFLSIAVKIHKYIDFKNIEKKLLKQMLKFSMPLIPNTICWWIISFLDRVMITHFYSASVNGVYSVANKIPSIITIIVGIFFDAWQISANKEFKNEKVAKFYTEIFDKLFSMVFMMSACIIPFSQIIIRIITGEAFWDAWIYMPILLMATSVFSLAQFLGSIYTASKNTNMAFVTNIVAAVVNFVLNWIFLVYIGPIGAAISTLISYVVLWIYRVINTRKIIKIEYNTNKIVLTIALITLEMVSTVLKFNLWYIVAGASMLAIIYINKSIIGEVLEYANKFLKSRRKEITVDDK